ncbi:MAG TPA: Gldg family protein, partial [Hyphomonadaceae bacterium]|nr:Gldg family protein [Hyphomonadaceae bacterium]
QGGDPIYFGVIGRNSVDDVIAIPFLAPERDAFLEYDLVRLIAQLDDPAPPRVAVISSLPAFQGDGTGEGDAFLLREMRRAFEVVAVDPDFQALPQGTDLLLMVHPPRLTEWQTYVVDQFLLRKGRALIALDPVSRAALGSGSPRAFATSSLGRLSETLGVSLAPDVVADRALALPVQVDLGGGRQLVEGQPLFLAVPRALMSAEDPVTADLSRAVNFGAAGHILAKPPVGVTFRPLAEATSQAGLVSAELAATDPRPRAVMEAYTPADGPLILAGRLSGKLRSLFTTPPPVPPQSDPVLARREADERAGVAPFVSRSETPAEIVLVADSDLLDDSFFLNPASKTPIADNAAFVLNALDNLGGDEALMALRSRAPAARPMERVDDMRVAARGRLYKEQQRLEALLAEAEDHLRQMEQQRAEGAVRTPEELAQMASFREQASQIRRQLRGVEREFRRDIDALAGRLELINIWLPPLFAAVLGAGLFFWRSKRRPDHGSRP